MLPPLAFIFYFFLLLSYRDQLMSLPCEASTLSLSFLLSLFIDVFINGAQPLSRTVIGCAHSLLDALILLLSPQGLAKRPCCRNMHRAHEGCRRDARGDILHMLRRKMPSTPDHPVPVTAT